MLAVTITYELVFKFASEFLMSWCYAFAAPLLFGPLEVLGLPIVASVAAVELFV